MRTTIRMKPELARRAKAYARKTDRTFTELVEDAVTDLLERQNPNTVELPPITVVGGDTPISMEDLKRSIEELDFEYDLKKLGVKLDSSS